MKFPGIVFALVFSFAASPAAAQFRLSEAAQMAASIESPEAFAESKLPLRDFYELFVLSGGAFRLSTELLGSWEFADRMHQLRYVDFRGGYDYGAIMSVSSLADAAREKTGIKYDVRETYRPVTWLSRLVRGEEVRMDQISSRGKVLLFQALAELGIEVIVFHRELAERDVPGSGKQLLPTDFATRGFPAISILSQPHLNWIYLNGFRRYRPQGEKQRMRVESRGRQAGVFGGNISALRLWNTANVPDDLRQRLLSRMTGLFGWSLETEMADAKRERGVRPRTVAGVARRLIEGRAETAQRRVEQNQSAERPKRSRKRGR